ncbi:MAG: hypothetical protein HYY16_07980 [Planctomycetes bacterium]|nr:hypothetical protein [Planctomycetota bacterium]
MEYSIELTEDERAFVIELLEGERRELRSVLHHTARPYQEDLRLRIQSIDRLLERFRAAPSLIGRK